MRKTLMQMLLLGVLTAALPARADEGARVTQFAWMAGCWSFASGEDGAYEEVWLPPTGNSMIGMSRRTEGGFTREFEFMRIATSGGGGFDFIAQPGGNPPVKFYRSGGDAQRAVFENPRNDFPTKITYAYTAPNQLNARIEGSSDGKPMAINFPLRRKPCP